MQTKKDTLKSVMVTLTFVAVAGLSTTTVDALADEPDAATVALEKKVDNHDRPPFYLGGMLTGGVLFEDGDNRMTSRDSSGLGVGGLALRTGGVIEDRHLIGALFHGHWVSTQNVLDGQGGDREWGAVSAYQLGPEYLYMTEFGLYFGASASVAVTFADNHVGEDAPDCNSPDCVQDHLQETDDHGAIGIGLRGTVGYEYRVSRYFAFNVEAYGGVLTGEDEYENNMTTPVFGLALGVGI